MLQSLQTLTFTKDVTVGLLPGYCNIPFVLLKISSFFPHNTTWMLQSFFQRWTLTFLQYVQEMKTLNLRRI